MADRLTKDVVSAKADNVSRLLGINEPDTLTDGSILLESAYGGYKVTQVTGNGGATRNLTHGFLSLRHCADFLDGMREALYIVEAQTKAGLDRPAADIVEDR